MYLRHLAITIAIAMLLSACNKQEVKPEPDILPVVKAQEPAKSKPKVAKGRPKPEVVILVSDVIPAYQQVADELKKRLQARASVVYVGGDEGSHAQLTELLKRPQYQQFVAIGLDAAQLANVLAGSEDEVIFCQVFNYWDYNLVGPRTKGVSALPGTADMFAAWSRMAPGLKVVGVITGPGLDEVIAAASAEAAKYGITLQHKVVGSDKETLFEFKQMAPSIQGLWLLPDNRVLSSRTIKDLMNFSVRNAKQVAVFSDTVMRLGGLLSVTASEREIAAKVLQRLEDSYRAKGVPGPDLLLLETGRLQVNTVVAKRYNLHYREE